MLEHNKIVQYLPGGWIKNLHHHLVYHNVKVKLFNGWIPMKQRLDDRIIMDFVTHSFPEWMWGHINRCRLYLHANTFTDITSNDGTCIPKQIRTVKGRIRENKLSFPAQGTPSKTDKHYWEHFIVSISDNGMLHLLLKEHS